MIKKRLAPVEKFNYENLRASERLNASHNLSLMRRLGPILRCKCARCITVTRTLLPSILAICITIAAGWKLLLEVHNAASFDDQHRFSAHQEASVPGFNVAPVDQAPEAAELRAPGPVGNSDAPQAKSYLSKPGLSRERFNAALAAGLIDPSRFGLVENSFPVSPGRERAISLSGPGVSIQNPGLGMESGAPLVTVAVAMSTASAAANPTKPIDPVSSLVLAMDKTASATPASATPRQSTDAEDRMPAPNRRKDSISRNKSVSVRFVKSAGIGSPGNTSARESISRNGSSPNGGKADSSSGQTKDNHDSGSRDLSENLQRFASDFVRANQTDNVAEQHRFFADSVHFYQEGDLSLAGVEAASRRHHRDRQIKSEVAGPAVATGPVNGGFFVIEQPVRWSQTQGSKVAQGRSVLRLRVVPINHGAWKITSIDEVNE